MLFFTFWLWEVSSIHYVMLGANKYCLLCSTFFSLPFFVNLTCSLNTASERVWSRKFFCRQTETRWSSWSDINPLKAKNHKTHTVCQQKIQKRCSGSMTGERRSLQRLLKDPVSVTTWRERSQGPPHLLQEALTWATIVLYNPASRAWLKYKLRGKTRHTKVRRFNCVSRVPQIVCEKGQPWTKTSQDSGQSCEHLPVYSS